MSLFKKKTKPALIFILEDELKRSKEQNVRYFYHILYENEKDMSQKWCEKNKIYMEVDHQTDGNIFYKFKF